MNLIKSCLFKPIIPTNVRDVMRHGKKYQITILPISTNYKLDNLYPITDAVEKWNTFIVGNDMTYILSKVYDDIFKEEITNEILLNKKSNNLIAEDLHLFLVSVWKETLKGNNLQFFMVYKSKLFFCNSYNFKNQSNNVIGAILFIRLFDSMPAIKDNIAVIPLRLSQESAR